MRRIVRSLLGIVVIVLVGCGEEPPPAPVPVSVTNTALGIRLAAVPADFELSVNDGDTLELVPSSSEVKGRLWFSVGPEERGVNVVAGMKGHERRIKEKPEAAYKGAQELVTHLGAAFYSRGQYLAGTTMMEETAVFAGHPSQTRLLSVTYRYPAGVDSSVRVQQLLDVLGEVQAISGLVFSS